MAELALEIVNAPDEAPISVTEGKLHLRIDADLTEDNNLIGAMIKAATNNAQDFTHRQFMSAEYDLFLDAFPAVICPPRPPLVSVTSIKYFDTDGNEQTIDAADYQVDAKSTIGRIIPTEGKSWPAVGYGMNRVTVRFVAGYGVRDNVPDEIKAAIRLTLGHLYEHRENVLVGVAATELPLGAKSLLTPIRIIDGL